MSNIVIDFHKEIKFNHAAWEKIHLFAQSGASIRNVTLYNTVNRVEYAKIFWELIKNLSNLKITEQEVLNTFNEKGIVVFVAELENRIIGMMVFGLWIDHELGSIFNAEYYLAGYEERNFCSSYALMYEAIQFFRQIGCDSLGLGLGENYNISEEDLIEWKKCFIGESKKEFNLRG